MRTAPCLKRLFVSLGTGETSAPVGQTYVILAITVTTSLPMRYVPIVVQMLSGTLVGPRLSTMNVTTNSCGAGFVLLRLKCDLVQLAPRCGRATLLKLGKFSPTTR